MKSDQKRRAIQIIGALQARGTTVAVEPIISLLQELIDAPERVAGVPDGWREDVELAAQMLTWGDNEGGLLQSQLDEMAAHQRKLFAMLAAAPEAPAVQTKPLAWIRLCSDGGYEGPIADCDSRMDSVRRNSGAWTPLYASAPAVHADLRDAERLNWALPFITGEDTQIANTRTILLANQLLTGKNGKAAIDAAIAAEKGEIE